MKIDCPACKKKLSVPDGFTGSAVKCPACGKKVDLPATVPAQTANLKTNITIIDESRLPYAQTIRPDISTSTTPQSRPPTYQGIVNAAGFMEIVSMLSLWIGCILGGLGAFSFIYGLAKSDGSTSAVGGYLFAFGLTCVFSSLGLGLFANLAFAIRDIARNTWQGR